MCLSDNKYVKVDILIGAEAFVDFEKNKYGEFYVSYRLQTSSKVMNLQPLTLSSIHRAEPDKEKLLEAPYGLKIIVLIQSSLQSQIKVFLKKGKTISALTKGDDFFKRIEKLMYKHH